MGNTSGCLRQFKDLRLFGTSCTMDDSSNMSDFASVTLTGEFDYATGSTSHFSVVEEQIEQSKAHWSTLVDHSGDTEEEEVEVGFEVSNKREFRALQRHCTWGAFFGNFSGDGMSTGSRKDYGGLVIGKKFAEGGQAELFEAHIKWNHPWNVEMDGKESREFVLKVFKKGTYLKHLKSQLPQGLLLERTRAYDRLPKPKIFPQWTSLVYMGILLRDGRFAFLMRKDYCDLHTLIEQHMKLRSGGDCGPFSKEEAEYIMYFVALGVAWLHDRNIVHRDLKASNVLVRQIGSRWGYYVADYECSIGVVGTGFFRAPEILQACKERKINERPELFSRAADVYSYAMTCYEILTGKLPLEDHPSKGSPSSLIDLVVNQGLRPEVPKYVEDWTRGLLVTCWQADPASRPTIGEILDVFSTNSTEVRSFRYTMKKVYGKNIRC